MIRELLQNERKFEECLDIAGGIPGIGIVSGFARTAFGKIQSVAGTIIAALGVIGVVFSNKSQHYWNRVFKLGIEHMIHGALNTIIGVGEMFLAMTPLSLLLLAYRVSRPKPLFEYGCLVNRNAASRSNSASYYHKSFNRRIA